MPTSAAHSTARRPVLALLVAALIMLAVPLSVTAVPTGRQAPDDASTVSSPSVTVSTPATSECDARQKPVGSDPSETVASGAATPTPLPVPSRPVGGQALAACGFAIPKGSPALPSDISAAAWLVADVDSGDVLGAKDPHGRYRPASTMKLLSLYVFLRNLPKLDQVVVGTDEDTEQEGTRVGIGPGGRYTVKELMLFLMLGSGNDVANALARANGGTAKTLAEMNAAAASLGALDTRAATVSGLDAAGQQTSVYDLALIARADLALEPFTELVSTKYAKVPGYGKYPGFGIANDNKLIFGYPGGFGGKTGFTDAAGNTYVGLAKRDGRRLVVAMLGGTQEPRPQWMQAASLLDWGFDLPAGTPGVGRLVADAAEATAAPGPSTSVSAPSRPTDAVGQSRPSATLAPPATTTASAAPATATASGGAIGGLGMALLWIGGGLLAILAAVAVYMGLRTDVKSSDEP